MSKSEIKKVLETFFASVDAKDIETVVSLYTEDATLIFPGDKPYQGKETIKQFYDESIDLFPETNHKIVKTIIEGNDAAFVIQATLKLTSGKTVEIPDVNIFEIKDNKIHKAQVYLDTALLTK